MEDIGGGETFISKVRAAKSFTQNGSGAGVKLTKVVKPGTVQQRGPGQVLRWAD